MTELAWQDPLRGGAVARESFRLAVAGELALVRLQLFSRDPAAAERGAAALGHPLPAVGTVLGTDRYRIAGRAPGDWLLLAGDTTTGALWASCSATLAGTTAAVTAATDGCVALRLAGRQRQRVLARGSTVDIAALQPGHCAATRFAGVVALLVPEEDAMLVIACRSLAAYLRDWCDAASVDCC